VYFVHSTLTILRTFVETESNHYGHKTVTSSGNFQSRGRNRVQSRIISATFAALQCMQPLSSQKKSLTCLVFPPCCKPKIESTPTEHEIYSAPSCSVRSATFVQCNFSAPTSHLHVAGVQCALVKQLQFAACHAVCRTQNCTELASTPPICDCPLTPFSNPIPDTRAQPVEVPTATMYKNTNYTVVLNVLG